MDFLDQARNLLNSLKKRIKELEEIKNELRTVSNENLEALYAEEFSVAMEISDVFETLSIMLDKMEKSEDTNFIANRLRTQAEAIIGEHEEYNFGENE